MIRDLKLTLGPTDTAGAVTANSERAIRGRIVAVEIENGTLAATADLVFSVQNTPGGVAKTFLTITDLSADAWYHPRELVHNETGAAMTGTAGGDRQPIVAVGNIRCVVAQGGAAKTGTAIIYYEEEA